MGLDTPKQKSLDDETGLTDPPDDDYINRLMINLNRIPNKMMKVRLNFSKWVFLQAR